MGGSSWRGSVSSWPMVVASIAATSCIYLVSGLALRFGPELRHETALRLDLCPARPCPPTHLLPPCRLLFEGIVAWRGIGGVRRYRLASERGSD